MADVEIRREGAAGRITLNRPAALNALTHDMVLRISDALAGWEADPEVGVVIIDAVPGKAFCAGGDLRSLYELDANDLGPARRFWTDEYRLNARIARYAKPYVALMDGIVMGGGVGVSAHGSHRIVTENTVLAMPEVAIGFMPDVGGTFLLARAPRRSGLYLGLTGHRMNAADAILTGFADRFVPARLLPGTIARAVETGDIESALAHHEAPAGPSPLQDRLPLIEEAFSPSALTECLAQLERIGSEWTAETLKTIRRNSPLSVACAFAAITQAAGFEAMEDSLRLEYRFAFRSLAETDFREGVRSAIIDRDRAPRWNPPRIEDVDPAKVARLLSSLGAHELDLG